MIRLGYEQAPFFRNCATFKEACLPSGPFRIKVARLSKLSIFIADHLGVVNPFTTFGGNVPQFFVMPQYFILIKDKRKYLVNTKGFNFCNNILEIEIIN